jgi:hypothetical protein
LEKGDNNVHPGSCRTVLLRLLAVFPSLGPQLRWDFQNALKTYNFDPPTTTVDFQNPRTFAKLASDPRTASLGGQPLMNLTLMLQW